jgi:tight adherence protein B
MNLSVLIAASGAILIFSLVHIAMSSGRKAVMETRFKKYLPYSGIEEIGDQVYKEKEESSRLKKSLKSKLGSRELSNYLAMSGVKLSASECIISWAAITILPILLVTFAGGNILTAAALGIIGFILPPFLISRSRKKRQEEFNKQLVEALAIMKNAIKSGFSFQQAMESIANEMQPPISTEFKKVLREVNYGISLEEALKHMVDRVKNPDLDLLVSAVLTATQVGGNLSEVLEVISETVKDRIRIKASIRVMTASGRFSGIIIGLLPIFIILVLMIINPEYFTSFFESLIGKIMLAVSAIMEVTGFLVINKIVNIKY